MPDASTDDPLIAVLTKVAPTTADPDICATHGTDWTRRFSGPVRAVVRPTSAGEVAAVLQRCNDAGAPVIPQGGNTGLVGGSVPGPHDEPAVILSTVGLTAVGDVDPLGRSVTVGAGVTIADLHRHAESAGLVYGVDPLRGIARPSAAPSPPTPGIRVCAYGMTRAQVMGGSAFWPTAPPPPPGRAAEGQHRLRHRRPAHRLEGTLGVITAVRVRLHTRRRPRWCCWPVSRRCTERWRWLAPWCRSRRC